ncbi:MAG: ACT domain-containing protein [Acidobacteria bacterium]|nr:ACT domain-containing protein [Acidobacteriota bacterium]
MSSYRLRVQVPERVGSLARLAGVLAEHGASIRSVDIHQVDGDSAIDEIIVEAQEEWEPVSLGGDIAAIGSSLVSVLEVDQPNDALAGGLQWAAAVVAAGVPGCDAHLAYGLAQLLAAPLAWLSPLDEGAALEGAPLALERGSPVVVRTAGFDGPAGPVPDGWLLVAADDPLDPQTLAFASRPKSMRFAACDVARIEAILAFRTQLVSRHLLGV